MPTPTTSMGLGRCDQVTVITSSDLSCPWFVLLGQGPGLPLHRATLHGLRQPHIHPLTLPQDHRSERERSVLAWYSALQSSRRKRPSSSPAAIHAQVGTNRGSLYHTMLWLTRPTAGSSGTPTVCQMRTDRHRPTHRHGATRLNNGRVRGVPLISLELAHWPSLRLGRPPLLLADEEPPRCRLLRKPFVQNWLVMW